MTVYESLDIREIWPNSVLSGGPLDGQEVTCFESEYRVQDEHRKTTQHVYRFTSRMLGSLKVYEFGETMSN